MTVGICFLTNIAMFATGKKLNRTPFGKGAFKLILIILRSSEKTRQWQS